MENRFVAYYRVSTERQGRSGLGLEAQKRLVSQFIQSYNGKLLEAFTDIESGKKVNRAQLQRAIALCQKEKASLVIAKIDRLSRDGYRILIQLEDAKVSYIDASSPNDDDFIKELRFSWAKEERKKTSERTKAALAEITAKGKKLGSPQNMTYEAQKKGAAQRKQNAKMNENNRRAAAFAQRLRKEGLSFRAIAKELNAHGFKTSQQCSFSAIQVKRVVERD